MSQFEDKLNAVLSNPESMAQIMKLAQSIGEQTAGSEIQDTPADTGSEKANPVSSGQDVRYRDLLEALKPYLSEQRRAKLDKAIRLSRLSGLARTALESGMIGDL